MKTILFVATLLFSACAHAAPTISNISGDFENGQSVVLTVTGAGTKTTAKPVLWNPFTSNQLPSSLGLATTMALGNMSWDSDEGYNGTGGLKGIAGNGNWTAQSDYNYWNTNSQKMYVFRRTKRNFLITSTTQNNKIFRVWPAGFGYPNAYSADNNGRTFVENIGVESGYWGNCNNNSTSYVAEEIIWRASSASGVKDGLLTWRMNGVQKTTGSILTKSAAAPGNMSLAFPVHNVVANKGSWSPSWSSSNNYWADDVYVDSTWQRVMIGDASTFANSRKFGFIVPSAWSDTSITGTMQFPTNDFPAESTAYVYVFDSNNAPNANGFSIEIGGVVAGDPPPVLSTVLVSVGNYQGGTISTATGTGFTSGLAVLVGTSPATGVVLLSSTRVQFTIPGGQSGGSGLDLRVTNSDGQFTVLQDTMSYTSASPTNLPPYDVSAGDDWEITLPATTLFSGLASDDGLPEDPGALSYLWEQASGPDGGVITFSDETALQTSAVFSSSGTYTATLTADDGDLSTVSAEVSIIVHPAVVTQSGSTAFPWPKP